MKDKLMRKISGRNLTGMGSGRGVFGGLFFPPCGPKIYVGIVVVMCVVYIDIS
jgi:hypothetical protein